MEWQQISAWAFQAIVSGSVIVGVGVLRRLQTSVEKLNENVAVVIEKTTQHERQLERHDGRIRDLEIR